MKDSLFLWLKLETGGLSGEPENGYITYPILEVSAIITDIELNEIQSYRRPIWSDKLGFMSDYAKKLHTESGLLRDAEESGVTIEMAESDIIAILKKEGIDKFCHTSTRVCFLAGQNVSNHELLYLTGQMPKLKQFLHFSVFDIGTMMLKNLLWNKGMPLNTCEYIDWSDETPLAKIKRTIQKAKKLMAIK